MRRLSILVLLLLPLIANAQPYPVEGDVKAPVAIVHVNPQYPEEARQQRISGMVVLETVIDHTGEAVDVVFNLTINFKLDKNDSDDAPLRVGGDVRAPVLIEKVEPLYTEEARKAQISGIVIIEAVIGRDGLVKNAHVLKPLPFGLDQAAIDAVKQWTFKPGTLEDKPVDVIFNLTVNFRLDKPLDPEH
jgi:TonB family protein